MYGYEVNLLRHIKRKLNDNEAIVSKAEKGNSVVIRFEKDYEGKIEFVSNK
jgi:uncharacterized protein (AIM24 family)